MKKYHMIRQTFSLGIIFLSIGTGLYPSLAQDAGQPLSSTSRGEWLYVGGSGPGNYTTIQEAINASFENDTVFVYDDSSPYNERIIIDKSIRLLGENKNTTIIVGVIGGDVVSVQADWVTISEFSIQYQCTYPSSDIAIQANHTCISQMILTATSNWFGISLCSSCDTRIYDNHISNKFVGISLRACSNNNTITKNTLTQNEYGVEIELSCCNRIYYNNFKDNTVNAADNGNNTWNAKYPSAGNYWDVYNGTDEHWGQNQEKDSPDGVGDTPLPIAGGENQDRYPLMQPYTTTQLCFDSLIGGFGMSGKITNVGTTTAFRVCWQVLSLGGFILFGRNTSHMIQKPLIPNEEALVNVFMLGLGKAVLTIRIWADNTPLYTGRYNVTILLCFIRIQKGGRELYQGRTIHDDPLL